MNRSAIWPAAGLALAAGLLENAQWPGSNVSLWLGPALLIGLSPMLGLSPWVYWPAALLSSLCWPLLQPLGFVWLVPLHWLLVYLTWRRPAVFWFLGATVVPPLIVGFSGQLSWQSVIGMAISVVLQYLLGKQLYGWLQTKLTQLSQLAKRKQAAHGVAIAGSASSQLDKLNEVALAISTNTEQMYAIYQELELLTRSFPLLDENLPARSLAAAQNNHQTKLRLAMLEASLQENLRFLAGKRGAALSEICSWAASKLETSAEQLGKRVHCQVEPGEDQAVEIDKQLPLAWLLQSICQREQRNLNANTTWISFAGYQANGKLRVVVTMQPEVERAGGEWPTLRPLSLAQWIGAGDRLSVECKKGVTSDGQIVITVEMS